MTPHHCRSLPYALAAMLSVASACDAAPATAPSGLPQVRMDVGGSRFTLEVAADDASRHKGLMERDALPTDHGMVFVFPDEADRGFWMHHTRFPLDIIYVRTDGTVVSVHTMKAYDEHTTDSDGPARYAIELPAGKGINVHKGDRLTLPSLPTTAQPH